MFLFWSALFCPLLAWPDPTVFIEADGEQDTKKQLKLLMYPCMDDDGVPSSYIQKVLGCVAKWRVKMHTMITVMTELEDPPETMTSFFDFTKRKFEQYFSIFIAIVRSNLYTA